MVDLLDTVTPEGREQNVIPDGLRSLDDSRAAIARVPGQAPVVCHSGPVPFWETQLAAALAGAALTLLGALVAAFFAGRQSDRDRESRERQADLDRLHSERVSAYAKVSRELDHFDQGLRPNASLVATGEELREHLDTLLDAAGEAQLVCSPELRLELDEFISTIAGFTGQSRSITWLSGKATREVRDAMRKDLGVPTG